MVVVVPLIVQSSPVLGRILGRELAVVLGEVVGRMVAEVLVVVVVVAVGPVAMGSCCAQEGTTHKPGVTSTGW